MSPKTIADLGTHQAPPPPVLGKSMLNETRKSLEQRIKELEARGRAENELAEEAGYDYDGKEAWLQAMQNCGRR